MAYCQSYTDLPVLQSRNNPAHQMEHFPNPFLKFYIKYPSETQPIHMFHKGKARLEVDKENHLSVTFKQINEVCYC